MRLYLAGNGAWHKVLDRSEGLAFLLSYYYFGDRNSEECARYAIARKWPVMIDSGAFSAFTLGKSIDIDAYIKFCKENRARFDYFIYLDAIGDWKQSKVNYEIMKKEGVEGIPTYHVGEPFEFFEWLIDHWDYVAIGGMVPYLGPTKNRYYSDALHRLMNKVHLAAKKKSVKLHGLGCTSWEYIRYPWHSIDSTSWLSGARFQRALVINKKGALTSVGARQNANDVARTAEIIGFDLYPIEQIVPSRCMKYEEYYPIFAYNAEVLKYCVNHINSRKEEK